MSFLATRRVGILACFLLLALANCGGGGGGGNDNGGLVATFTPDCTSSNSSCYDGAVTMQAGGASGSSFEVDVYLNKLNTVIGAADLTVSFDPSVVEYKGYSEGPALGTGSATTYVVTPGTGEIQASIAVAGGKSLSGGAVMITFAFKALKSGSSAITFLKKDALDGTALYSTPPGAIIPLGADGWSGGNLVAN